MDPANFKRKGEIVALVGNAEADVVFANSRRERLPLEHLTRRMINCVNAAVPDCVTKTNPVNVCAITAVPDGQCNVSTTQQHQRRRHRKRRRKPRKESGSSIVRPTSTGSLDRQRWSRGSHHNPQSEHYWDVPLHVYNNPNHGTCVHAAPERFGGGGESGNDERTATGNHRQRRHRRWKKIRRHRQRASGASSQLVCGNQLVLDRVKKKEQDDVY